MQLRTVTAEETIDAEVELCFDICFALLTDLPDPAELREAGAPPEVVREARIRLDGHQVVEIDRPNHFVLDSVIGAVTTRVEMRFQKVTRGTGVRQIFSIRPDGWIARLLTAIPRRRLEQSKPSMQEQLRYLKSRCEDRSFLLNAHQPSQERQLRMRAKALIAGSAFFEILIGSGNSSAKAVQDLPTILLEAARLHLTLSSGDRPDDAAIQQILESEIYPDFERRLGSGDAESLSFFVDGFPYYIAWANRLTSVDEDGLKSLDAIARGDREVMGHLVLDALDPPKEEEVKRALEKMNLELETLFFPLANWKRHRLTTDSVPGVNQVADMEVDRDRNVREMDPGRRPATDSLVAEGESMSNASRQVEISVSASEDQIREILEEELPRDFYDSIEFQAKQPEGRNPFAGNVRGAPEVLQTFVIFSAGAIGGGVYYDLVKLAVLKLKDRLGSGSVQDDLQKAKLNP